MKEIEKVSIGGYAFTLDKDAAVLVEKYLKDLGAHYLGQPGGREIMEGIEERMAELLLERCGANGVVTAAHIQGVIGILGRPERIEADDPNPTGRRSPRARSSTATWKTRRSPGCVPAWPSTSTSTSWPCASSSA